jgi:dolichol kinase
VFGMVVHIIKSWNSEDKGGYKKINEIAYTIIFLAFALYYPLLVTKIAADKKGVIFPNAIDDFVLLGNILIVGVMLGVVGWAISAKIRTIRNPELLKEQNNYEHFCKKFLEEYPERSKIKRRITHTLPGGVVFLTFLMSYFFFQGILGDRWSNYAFFIVIIIGVDFALTFLLEDLIRMFDFSYMPPNAIRMCNAGLTDEELDTFSSTSVMVFSFGPFMYMTFPIFFIVLLITSIADAMAAVVGIKIKNKHRFPKSTDKSIEGYFGGFVFTFLCTVFGAYFSNFFGLSNWSLEIILMLSLLLSVVFVLIDIITSKIRLQDNYLNPFVIGIVMAIFLMYNNIPIC